MGGHQGGIQGRGRPVGGGQPIFDLGIGRLVRGPRDGGARSGDAGSGHGGDDGRNVVKRREGGVARCGEVRRGVLGLHPVVVQRRGRQTAQGLAMGGHQGGIQGRGRPVGGGQPIFDLGIGRLVRGPRDGGARSGDAGSRHGGDDGRNVVKRREGGVARRGEVPRGVLGLHPVVVQRRGRQAAQRLAMGRQQGGIQGRGGPVGGGQPVFELR